MLMVSAHDNWLLQRMALFQASTMGCLAAARMATPTVVKKVIRLDVPVEDFPNGKCRGSLALKCVALNHIRMLYTLALLRSQHDLDGRYIRVSVVDAPKRGQY